MRCFRAVAFLFCLASAALADPILATFSGEFQNPVIHVGDGVQGRGGSAGIFSTFGDTILSLSFTGNQVSPDHTGESFVAGVLSVFAYPQDVGNQYSIQLVLSTDADDPEFQGPEVINIDLAIGLFRNTLAFPDHPEFGVLQYSTLEESSVELKAQFGSIDFLGFGNVVDGTGQIVPIQSSVPEPSTISMLFTAAGIALFQKLRHSVRLT